jgi:hypothetical protein
MTDMTLPKLSTIALAGLVLAFAIQFIRPARTNPHTDAGRTLHARMTIPPDIASLLDRSCRDCHSHDTRWPWYSNVAPVSWWVIDHVNHARSHFNYSDWAQYDRAEARRLLENSCALARKSEMPLPSYLRMHRAARLSSGDVAALCAWVERTQP